MPGGSTESKQKWSFKRQLSHKGWSGPSLEVEALRLLGLWRASLPYCVQPKVHRRLGKEISLRPAPVGTRATCRQEHRHHPAPRNRTVDARVKSLGSGKSWRKGKHTSTTTTVRSDQMCLMHGQLASLSTAADDWNDTEAGEESEIDAAVKEEALLSVPPPRWLDEQTEIPSEEYNSYDYQLTAPFEYRIFLPHRAPNCGMTTTFSDLCDFLCEPLKHAPSVREKRQELAASAKLPMCIQMQLYAILAVKKEQNVALEQLRKFVWDYRKSIFMTTFLAELPLTLKRFLNMESIVARKHADTPTGHADAATGRLFN